MGQEACKIITNQREGKKKRRGSKGDERWREEGKKEGRGSKGDERWREEGKKEGRGSKGYEHWREEGKKEGRIKKETFEKIDWWKEQLYIHIFKIMVIFLAKVCL